MQKIIEIYKKYDIMPNLQDHQLRVASVAKKICDSLLVPVDADIVIKTCLLHDMGNIIKFNLQYFPQFLEPQGLEYWKDVQKDYILKYGRDEHAATIEIAKELVGDEKVLKLIVLLEQAHQLDHMDSMSLEEKICCYVDNRVSPHGVISLEERSIEAYQRYKDHPKAFSDDNRILFQNNLKKIENEIFLNSCIEPESVTDESISEILEDLKNYMV